MVFGWPGTDSLGSGGGGSGRVKSSERRQKFWVANWGLETSYCWSLFL